MFFGVGRARGALRRTTPRQRCRATPQAVKLGDRDLALPLGAASRGRCTPSSACPSPTSRSARGDQPVSSTFRAAHRHTAQRGAVGQGHRHLAISPTLFGSATSLGLGALQIDGGLERVVRAERPGTGLLSGHRGAHGRVRGLRRVRYRAGIQWLSNINMVLAALLAVFLFVVGPTVLILNMVPGALGDYLPAGPR